ncbi:hypothetical protein D3C84_1158380 [compost metagenome]
MPTDPVTATPLVAWRLDDYWVTAVQLRNRTEDVVTLDPRHLQAQLYGASFQHGDLGPRGTPEDTTVAYLLTRGGGLEQALFAPLPKAPEADDER